VEYVYPRGAQPYAETFAEHVAASVARQTTYVTSQYPPQYSSRGLYLVPLFGVAAWQVSATPILQEGDPAPDHLLFDGRIEVFAPQPEVQQAEVGQAFNVLLTWRAVGAIKDDESVTIRLMRSNGKLATNADVRLDPTMQVGEVRTQRLTLGVPLDLYPGEYRIIVGVYRNAMGAPTALKEQNGADFVPTAPVTVVSASLPPITQHPLQASGVASGGHAGATLIGVDYDTGVPGQLRVFTHWQLSPVSATVVLQDAAANAVAAQQLLPAASGQYRFYTLVADVPPMHGLQLSTTVDQSATARLSLPDYASGERYVPFANQIVLVGSDLKPEGDALKVDLQWLSARAITTDFVVSARVSGQNFYAQHDSVPALGALPTLKWIRGSRVVDRHPMALGGYAGPLQSTIVIYDAFTQQPLPMLDERN
jgi:hypothetical protein